MRSLKKGPFVDENLIKKIKNQNPGNAAVIKTWSRKCTITPEMVGFVFGVHNGKEHIPVRATEDMVGHKLGEFSSTTRFSRHGGRMQRDLEKGAAEAQAQQVAKTQQPEKTIKK